MSYIGKLAPTVGNGLGGLPERRENVTESLSPISPKTYRNSTIYRPYSGISNSFFRLLPLNDRSIKYFDGGFDFNTKNSMLACVGSDICHIFQSVISTASTTNRNLGGKNTVCFQQGGDSNNSRQFALSVIGNDYIYKFGTASNVTYSSSFQTSVKDNNNIYILDKSISGYPMLTIYSMLTNSIIYKIAFSGIPSFSPLHIYLNEQNNTVNIMLSNSSYVFIISLVLSTYDLSTKRITYSTIPNTIIDTDMYIITADTTTYTMTYIDKNTFNYYTYEIPFEYGSTKNFGLTEVGGKIGFIYGSRNDADYNSKVWIGTIEDGVIKRKYSYYINSGGTGYSLESIGCIEKGTISNFSTYIQGNDSYGGIHTIDLEVPTSYLSFQKSTQNINMTYIGTALDVNGSLSLGILLTETPLLSSISKIKII